MLSHSSHIAACVATMAHGVGVHLALHLNTLCAHVGVLLHALHVCVCGVCVCMFEASCAKFTWLVAPTHVFLLRALADFIHIRVFRYIIVFASLNLG